MARDLLNGMTFVLVLHCMVATTASAAALEKINASYGAISGSMAQTWVAKEAKLFEKHGLDLNLVYISGGPRSIMSLIGGSVEFVNHSGMPALEAYQRGADTALIASPMNHLEHSLVVQKHITSVEQLRGKVLGMSTVGSLTDILLREGLRLNGIAEKDLTILSVGDLGARLSSLQTGRIHGAIIAGVQTMTANKLGFRTKPDYALSVLKKYVANQDPEVLSNIYNLYKERLMTKPTPTASVAKTMLYLLSRSSPQVSGANPEGFIEARYVNELESSGFFDEMNRQYGK